MGLKEWTSEYGGLGFPLPEIAGTYSGKKLIVCGDAGCIWIDLELFGAREGRGRGKVHKEGWDILTVNKIVETFPGEIEHAYSNQSRVLNVAFAARRDEYKVEFKFDPHTHSSNAGANWHWPWGGFGTSALGAVFVGLGLGYERIVLCGVPLTDGPHNGEPHWRSTTFASSEAAGSEKDDRDSYWKRAIEYGFEGKVKSMSGRTMTWLGDARDWK